MRHLHLQLPPDLAEEEDELASPARCPQLSAGEQNSAAHQQLSGLQKDGGDAPAAADIILNIRAKGVTSSRCSHPGESLALV